MEKRKRTETVEERELCYLPAPQLRDQIRKKTISPWLSSRLPNPSRRSI
jgi:hypothetical protein